MPEEDLKHIFSSIYEKGIWSRKRIPYYSGAGSHVEAMYMPYVRKMIGYLKTQNRPTVLDLGCGDMNVSKHFLPYCGSYFGMDIAEKMILFHKSAEFPKHATFFSGDFTQGPLPDANVVLIRQVFQHLSNSHILRSLSKLQKYKTVFITEHVPMDSKKKVPNIDIQSGAIRIPLGSGVYLDEPPFNLPAESLELFLEIPIYRSDLLRTIKWVPGTTSIA